MSKISLRVADSESSKEFNLDEVVTTVSWETSMEEQPGKMTFEVIDTIAETFFEGSNAVLAIDGQKVFDGYVFKRKRTDSDTMSITVYDRLRYLQNKDTYVFENKSAEEIFITICRDFNLPYATPSFTNYKTSPIAHDNKELYSIIRRALDETLVAKGQYLIVRDYVGTLELADVANLRTNIVIGERGLLPKFDYESSIDTNTYNYVKLVQENKDSKKREVYIAKDSSTIYKWGRLQYTDTVDESLTEAQIKERTDQMLNLYNRKTKTLSVEGIGEPSLRAGNGVVLHISKLAQEDIAQMQYAYITKASHTYSNGELNMKLTLEVPA